MSLSHTHTQMYTAVKITNSFAHVPNESVDALTR